MYEEFRMAGICGQIPGRPVAFRRILALGRALLVLALLCTASPAVFARAWSPEKVRNELEEIVAKTRGCSVEIIMKDISTVNHHPERLREWAEIAMWVARRVE